ncbi:DUF934 domain-containing protein [Rhodobacteraceae bacterium NNCM2]|nr:DUF934 domain-containing protein [Coraliihabitans acroporae]
MLLLDRTGEIDDLWPVAGDVLPEAGRVLVPLSRLDEARATGLELGVDVPNNVDPKELTGHFDRIAMISVDFPSFADGRGFSIGRSLRAAGFIGRLRASGPVISDQFTYLLQCGFDEVAVPDDVAVRQPIEDWIAQLDLVTTGYQRGVGERGSILDQRRTNG